MAIDYDPLCAICGVPFCHVDALEFSDLGYNPQVLSAAQCAVSLPYSHCFRFLAHLRLKEYV